MVEQFYLTNEWDSNRYYQSGSTFSEDSEREPHHQMQFSVIPRIVIRRGSYPSAENIVSVFILQLYPTGQCEFESH